VARAFDGTAGQLSIASTTLPSAAPFTMFCRYKQRSALTTGTLLNIGTTANDTNYWLLRTSSTGQTSLFVNQSTQDTISTTAVVTDFNAWHSAAAIMRTATDRSVYLDGTNRIDSAVSKAPVVSGSQVFAIATRHGLTAWAGGVPHHIADVCIYDIDLTDGELKRLHAGANPFTIRPGHLVSYWPLRPDATALRDFGRRALHLTASAAGTQWPSIGLPPATQQYAAIIPPVGNIGGTTPVSSTSLFSITASQGVAATSLLSITAGQGIVTASNFTVTAGQGIAGTGVLPLEAAGQIAVQAAAVIPLDALGGVTQPATLPLEALTAILSGLALPLDGAQGVTTALVAALEALKGVQGAGQFPIEAAGQLVAANTVVVPIEAAGGIANPLGLPIDAFQAGITASAGFPLEGLKSASTLVVTPIETSKGVASALVLVLDATQQITAVAILPIDSELPAGFTQPGTLIISDFGPQLVITDQQNGRVLVGTAGSSLVLTDGL